MISWSKTKMLKKVKKEGPSLERDKIVKELENVKHSKKKI